MYIFLSFSKMSRWWESDPRSLSYQDSALPLSYNGLYDILVYFHFFCKKLPLPETS